MNQAKARSFLRDVAS